MIASAARRASATTPMLMTVAVVAVVFAYGNQLGRAVLFGLFALALVIPFVLKSNRRNNALVAAVLIFSAYGVVVLLKEPLTNESAYNGILSIACVVLVLSLSRLSPAPLSIDMFATYVANMAFTLLITTVVLDVLGIQAHWPGRSGYLFLLYYFVLVAPNHSAVRKMVYAFLWVVQTYAADDRGILLAAAVLAVAWMIWPMLARNRSILHIAFVAFAGVLIAIPLVYVWLSRSQWRSTLDQLALDYTSGRFFSGRDAIWANMIEGVIENGVLTGGGHAVVPTGIFVDDVSAHNTFVSILSRMGVIGLLLFLVIFWTLLASYAVNWRVQNIRLSAAFTIAILAKQSTEFSMIGNNVSMAIMSWLVIGMGAIYQNSMRTARIG